MRFKKSTTHESKNPKTVSLLFDDAIELPKINLTLPPQWVDQYEGVNQRIVEINDLFKEINKLSQKRIKAQFGDQSALDKEINFLTHKATNKIHDCEKNITQIKNIGETLKESANDKKIRENIYRSLATQVQELTSMFRKQQKNYFDYLKKLQKNDGSVDFLQLSSEKMLEMQDIESQSTVDMELMEDLSKERDEQINGLVESINELSSIFKQMSHIVIEQGTILDRIDYNLQETLQNTKKGNVQLKKADEYHKSTRATKCMMILIALIIFFLVILIVKQSN